jgi:hypothetical protein
VTVAELEVATRTKLNKSNVTTVRKLNRNRIELQISRMVTFSWFKSVLQHFTAHPRIAHALSDQSL